MDQATDLRRLVRHDGSHVARRASTTPRLIAVTSGKGGVGTTTIAINLSVALAQAGQRTILVDADLDGADIASVCRLDDTYSLAHVLAGARSVHEALCRGPGGILVLPGAWAPGALADCSPAAQERLLSSLRAMGDHADVVVLDVGSGLNRVVRRFWHAADQVVLVATPEDASIMDAYAAIKVLTDGDPQLPIGSLINLAPDSMAADVHDRLARVCQRFLGVQLAAWGHLPASAQVLSAVRAHRSFVLESPDGEATRQMAQLVERLLAVDRSVPAPRMLTEAQGHRGSRQTS